MKHLLVATALASTFAGNVTAQQRKEPGFIARERVSFIGAIGGQNYLGNLVPRKYDLFGATYDFSPSIRLGAEYDIHPMFRARFSYYGTQLTGNEASDFQKLQPDEVWRKRRQLSFTNVINDFSLVGIVDILGFMQKRWESGEMRFFITPYIGAGIGYSFMNPTLGDVDKARGYAYDPKIGEQAYYERDIVQKAPIKGAVNVPITLGVRWQVNNKSGVFVETTRHFYFTGYLDRVANWTPKAEQYDGFINYAVGYRYTLQPR